MKKRFAILVLAAVFVLAIIPARPASAAVYPTLTAVTDVSGRTVRRGGIAAFQFETTRGSYEVENALLFIYDAADTSDDPAIIGYADLTIQDQQNLYGENTEARFADRDIIHWIVDWDTSGVAPGTYRLSVFMSAFNGTGSTASQTFRSKEISGLITVTEDDRPAAVPMYRLFNPYTHEHLYTEDAYERAVLISGGWHDEAIGWYAPRSSSVPVYRLFAPMNGEHHYTIDLNERNTLVELGWNYEGVGWYSDPGQAVPLYRQYSPVLETGFHNYTADLNERNTICDGVSWRDEGIGWYGVNP